MLRKPHWSWRIALVLACMASAGGLLALMLGTDRFRTLKLGDTAVEIACVSRLLVIVPMNLRPLTIEERADAIDALDDELAAAATEKRRIDAALSEASDADTPRLLDEAVRIEAESDRLLTLWSNLIIPDDMARAAARESIKGHLYKRTIPTRNGPIFESTPGFREQKAYIIAAWLPATAFAAGLLPLPSALLTTLRMRRRRRRGHCVCCNYMLEGLSEPRCPECGTPFERAERLAAESHTAACQSGRRVAKPD